MDEERDLVVFEDDAGNELTMEVLDYLAYEGKEYALLTEYVEDKDDKRDEDDEDAEDDFDDQTGFLFSHDGFSFWLEAAGTFPRPVGMK